MHKLLDTHLLTFILRYLFGYCSGKLLIQIAKRMKWPYGNVCALQSPLEQAPEVFNAVCVDATIDILFQ